MITQRIDKDDDILGVYHEWSREIAKSFDKLSVICLYEGRNELPDSIKVFSLGKESSKIKILKKLRYTLNFFRYIWKLRKDYDVVFVHMTPIYVVIGWPLWVLMRKRIFLFYAHYKTGILLRIASLFCKNIITSVPGSCGLKSSKVIAIGQGIDTNRFYKNSEVKREEESILFVGRISPVKNLDILIDALRILRDENRELYLVVVGGKDYGEEGYFSNIKERVKNYNLDRIVVFEGETPNTQMPEVYSKYEIYVNLTQTGSFDKTILEAMSCECLPIVSNELYRNIFPRDLQGLLIFKHNYSKELAYRIQKVMDLPREERIKIGKRMREIVLRDHSLSTLGVRLRAVFSNNFNR